MPSIVYYYGPPGDVPVRHTPAFFSYDELQRCGVTNCAGFDVACFGIRARMSRASEEQVLSALSERRDYFLRFAHACGLWRPLRTLRGLIHFRPFVRSETRRSRLKWHLVWARLWWLEWRAGPVTVLEGV